MYMEHKMKIMDRQEEKIEFTEQRADPSVPVGDVGGSAGPSRPSSCDRNASSVVNQAEGQRPNTGEEEYEYVFKGRPRIERSPKEESKEVTENRDSEIDNIIISTDEEEGSEVEEERETQQKKGEQIDKERMEAGTSSRGRTNSWSVGEKNKPRTPVHKKSGNF